MPGYAPAAAADVDDDATATTRLPAFALRAYAAAALADAAAGVMPLI